MIMKSGLGILMITAATLAGAATSSHAQSPAQYGQGAAPGMMGQGMGPGMMGQGMGPGPMMTLPQDLSVENVRHMLEHRLARQGNPNLKLGEVEENDEDTIEAEIVTQHGLLVQRWEMDRHTGWMRPAA